MSMCMSVYVCTVNGAELDATGDVCGCVRVCVCLCVCVVVHLCLCLSVLCVYGK